MGRAVGQSTTELREGSIGTSAGYFFVVICKSFFDVVFVQVEGACAELSSFYFEESNLVGFHTDHTLPSILLNKLLVMVEDQRVSRRLSVRLCRYDVIHCPRLWAFNVAAPCRMPHGGRGGALPFVWHDS